MDARRLTEIRERLEWSSALYIDTAALVAEFVKDGFEKNVAAFYGHAPADIRDLLGERERLENALKAIAAMWPDPDCAPDILTVSGVNDGKSRAIIADAAIKIARDALKGGN